MNRLKIAFFFGGCSEERHVSVKSAIEIARHVDTRKYEPLYIGITPSGIWKMCKKPSSDWLNKNCPSAILSPDKKMRGLLILENGRYQVQPIDAAFPVLHGKFGEDGAIQGLFELSGIPYVGCDIQSSAVCMDKSLTYAIARNAGFHTPKFIILQLGEEPALDTLTYPIFVKPARSGSSFGVHKVHNQSELSAAIQTARQYDSKVLLEQAVFGLEIGCAILGNAPELTVGEVDQISLSHGIFRIHQEERPEEGSENASISVPADLPKKKRLEIQETAKGIYKALGCKGLSRVDMFLQENGQVILNEVNTLPGFTTYSRYPRMMAATGLPLSKLIDACIAQALKG